MRNPSKVGVEEQLRLHDVACDLEAAAEVIQGEYDEAVAQAEAAWDEYYSYDPGEEV